MSDITYTYKPHFRRRRYIAQFDESQINFFLLLYKRWRHSRFDVNYNRVRFELARMFGFRRDSREVSRILAEINQVQPNYRDFATMFSSQNEQIEDILDQFREEFNQGTPDDYDDEEYDSYAS